MSTPMVNKRPPLATTAGVAPAVQRRLHHTLFVAGSLALGGLFTLLGTALTAFSAFVAYRLTHPRACAFSHMHRDSRRNARKVWTSPPRIVRFHSSDGVALFGRLFKGTRRSAIVLAHGYTACQEELLELAAHLQARGYNVLLFDFRNHGRSGLGRQGSSIGYHERQDICAAVRYLKRRRSIDPQGIGVLGMSMGAATALLAAADCEDIRAVVADSPFADLREAFHYGIGTFYNGLPVNVVAGPLLLFSEMFSGVAVKKIRPLDVIEKIAPRPILFIHGLDDAVIHHDHSRKLYEAYSGPKDMWSVEGADHVQAGINHPDEYLKRVDDFFSTNLAALWASTSAHTCCRARPPSVSC